MILTFFYSIWSRVYGYVLAGGAVLALLLGVYLKGRQDASTTAKINEINKNYENLKEANKIEEIVHNLPESDIDRRLDKFMRD